MKTTDELPRVLCLAAHPSALADARWFVRDLADEHRLSQELGEELALAVTEAIANAMVHTDTMLVLVSWRTGERDVEVQVKDDGIFERRRGASTPTSRLTALRDA